MNSNIEIINVFPTQIFRHQCSLDLQSIKNYCYEFSSKNPSLVRSNVGGYQSDTHFFIKELENEIIKALPRKQSKPLKDIKVDMWLNINKRGDHNELHMHDPFNLTALSGVFYVDAPKNSGALRLYDPRGCIAIAKDQMYYNEGFTYVSVDPVDNQLIIFPAWIQHMVEPNMSEEDRVSIAFNIEIYY